MKYILLGMVVAIIGIAVEYWFVRYFYRIERKEENPVYILTILSWGFIIRMVIILGIFIYLAYLYIYG